MGILHHIRDESFHIHHRRDQQGLFRRVSLQRLHGKPRADAHAIQPDMRPHRLHAGVYGFYLRHSHPRQKPLRAVFPCAMLGQVDGQHLPARFTGCSGKTFCFFLAAVLTMEIEIDPAAPAAVQDGRDARKSHGLFFHKGFSLSDHALHSERRFVYTAHCFSSSLLSVFSMIAHPPAKHKQKRSRSALLRVLQLPDSTQRLNYFTMLATSAAKSSARFSRPSPFWKRVNLTILMSPPRSLATLAVY